MAGMDRNQAIVALLEDGNAISLDAVATDLERAGVDATATRAVAARSRLTAQQIRAGEVPH